MKTYTTFVYFASQRQDLPKLQLSCWRMSAVALPHNFTPAGRLWHSGFRANPPTGELPTRIKHAIGWKGAGPQQRGTRCEEKGQFVLSQPSGSKSRRAPIAKAGSYQLECRDSSRTLPPPDVW